MDAIVVTFNSAADLAALLSCEPVRDSFDRVVVVDNGSSDTTRDVASALGAHVVRSEHNRGFGAGVNLGAREVQGPCFAVLNPDIRLTADGVMDRLVRHIEHPAVGAAAPALQLPNGALQGSAREVPSPLDLCRRRFWKRYPDEIHIDKPVTVEWVVGACMVVSRAAFEAVGGFDERYFLYFEDVDFGVRLRQSGYSIVYDPTVRVLHGHAAASTGALSSWSTRQHIRSAYTFYSHHSGYLWPRRARTPGRAVAAR
jgi:N-acetylglucosaminyl-diphospho-decaprenol L-rhamnosyltransferase